MDCEWCACRCLEQVAKASMGVQIYRPTEDTDGRQRAQLSAVVQALQHTAEQPAAPGTRAHRPVTHVMARVLSRIICMEHRCIDDRMDFVCALMWEAAEQTPSSTVATADPSSDSHAQLRETCAQQAATTTNHGAPPDGHHTPHPQGMAQRL